MHIHTKFRRRLLGSSALVAGAFFMATSGAQAGMSGSCSGLPVADNVTITCDGNVGYGIVGDGSHVTVTLNADASVNVEGDRALDMYGDHNAVTLGANSQLYAYSDNKAANFDGSNNTMTLNGESNLGLSLGEEGSGTALDMDGDNNLLTLNDGSSIAVTGNVNDSNSDTYALNIVGAGNRVVLNGGSFVSLNVNNEAKYAENTALLMSGSGSSLTLNNSSVTATTNNTKKYASTTGVDIYGSSAALTLNGTSSVEVYARNHLKYSQTYGVQMYGEGATLTLNGTSRVDLDVYNYGRDGTAKAVALSGAGAKLTLNDTSSINVSAGTDDTSNEFYGAAVSGDAPVVTLNGTSSINMTATGDGGGSYIGLAVSNNSHPVDDETVADINVGSVTLNGGSSVNVNLNGSDNVNATGVLLGGTDRRIKLSKKYDSYAPSLTLNGTSSINVIGSGEEVDSRYAGVIAEDKYANVTLNDNSSIQVYAEYGNGYSTGIQVYGSNATITLNDHAAINVGNEYTDNATGIAARNGFNQIVLNDDAVIHTEGYEAVGVDLGGDYNTLTLNDNAAVFATGKGSAGVFVAKGSNNSIELNGNSQIVSTDTGVGISGGYYNSLTLNDNSAVVSNYGDGVVVDLTTGTTVTLNGRSSIRAYNGAGIRVTGQDSYYNEDEEETYYYHNRDVTINVGQGTGVYGETGIVVEDGAEDTFINVSGIVYGTDGTAIDLSQAYNSTLQLGTGAQIIGDVVGNGHAYDRLILTGEGVLHSNVYDFANLTVNADEGKIWNLTSDLNLGSGYAEINSGELAVNGSLTANEIIVNTGGTLGGSGTVYGDVIVAGNVSPGNSPGTLNVVGNVNFTPGSGFKVQVEGNTADLLNVIGGTVTIDPGTTITMEFLGGVDGFVGDVIASPNPIVGTFTNFVGGVFDYSTPGFVSLTSASPAAPNAGMTGSSTVGFTFLDAVIDNAENGIGRSSGIWGTGLYNQTNRTAMGSAKGVDVQGSGLAMGGDVFRSENFGIGLAGGYIDSTATAEGGGSETGIKGYNVAAYSTYGMGNTFLTAAVTGAYQEQDVARRVLSLGTVTTANSSPEAWTAGAGMSLGHIIPVQGSWTITPRASFGWQHVARDGYSETGGGLAAMSLDKLKSDTVRGQVGAELAFTVKDPNAIWSVRPSIRAALAKELRSGDSTVNGRFLASGAAFSGKTDDRDQTYGAIGAGVDVVIGQGLTAFAQYDGAVGGSVEKSSGVRVGARFEW